MISKSVHHYGTTAGVIRVNSHNFSLLIFKINFMIMIRLYFYDILDMFFIIESCVLELWYVNIVLGHMFIVHKFLNSIVFWILEM